MKPKKAITQKCSRDYINTRLDAFCYLSGEHDIIEVTEWANGDGVDVCIDGRKQLIFSLTFGEFDALKYLIKTLKLK